MTDALIEMYDRGFERDSIVWIAVARENWLKISDRVTQLRQELSLAEEGLANYEEEVQAEIALRKQKDAEIEQLNAELHRIRNDSLVWAMTCPHNCQSCDAMYESIKRSVPHPTGDGA